MKKINKFLMEHINIIRLIINYILLYIAILVFGDFNIWLLLFLYAVTTINIIISVLIIDSYKNKESESLRHIESLNEIINNNISEYEKIYTEYSNSKKYIEDIERKLDDLNSKNTKYEKTITEITSLNNELHLLVSDYTSEKDKILRESEELHHQLDESQNNKFISMNDIYSLYQIYLLIRKYNILQYQITVNPIHADIYCKMAIYTKISINKELIPNVNYHIDGTDVIL